MNRNVFLVNGAIIMVFGILFSIVQTRAFGNHFIPQSTSEAITDLISFLQVIIGYVLVTIGHALPKNPKN